MCYNDSAIKDCGQNWKSKLGIDKRENLCYNRCRKMKGGLITERIFEIWYYDFETDDDVSENVTCEMIIKDNGYFNFYGEREKSIKTDNVIYIIEKGTEKIVYKRYWQTIWNVL